MIVSQAQTTLLQRIDGALISALRNEQERSPPPVRRSVRNGRDLLIEGVAERELPSSLDHVRFDTPHSGMALTVNSFVPWQGTLDLLPLGGRLGFDAIQFDVRCPTGLRGTPPHLNLLVLRADHAIAVVVRSVEYLTRRRSSIASAYDDLLTETPGLMPWFQRLTEWRHRRLSYRHVDLPALVKYATALRRTFPDRPSTLLYLFWEPLDASSYDEFRDHRDELLNLADGIRDAQVGFAAQSFDELWKDWSNQPAPVWIGDHVARLRSRYAVSLTSAN